MAVFPEAERLISCDFDYRTRTPEPIQKSRVEHREGDSPSQQRWPTAGQSNPAKMVSLLRTSWISRELYHMPQKVLVVTTFYDPLGLCLRKHYQKGPATLPPSSLHHQSRAKALSPFPTSNLCLSLTPPPPKENTASDFSFGRSNGAVPKEHSGIT